eukprot:TRINITY_DN11293_c1_g1_i1.p1 TRINITY_DN11293_c1_g1~~TRINITY_DN11293_c1_g1_i1.p1  ORF type:complete len:104 (+),score=17.74 TRINITY_DN11293_c1_g1_i1:143-454(+)
MFMKEECYERRMLFPGEHRALIILSIPSPSRGGPSEKILEGQKGKISFRQIIQVGRPPSRRKSQKQSVKGGIEKATLVKGGLLTKKGLRHLRPLSFPPKAETI